MASRSSSRSVTYGEARTSDFTTAHGIAIFDSAELAFLPHAA